jgi:membrane-associated phospholipid phosphatase
MIWVEEQLRFIRVLQEGRGPIIDALFRFLNFFDSAVYITLLVVFIWIGCSWRWGARMGLLVIANGLLNQGAKLLFASPRPSALDPSLAFVKASGFGFPSGGAQTSFLLGCILIHYWNSPWAWPIGLFYLLLISVSRVVLGVHFPLDIAGGWMFGLLVFLLFIKGIEPIERICHRWPNRALAVVWTASLLCLAALPHRLLLFPVSALATSLGLYLSCRYSLSLKPSATLKEALRRGCVGVATTLFVGYLLHLLPLHHSYKALVGAFGVGLWVTLCASPVCRMLRLG